MRKLFCVIVFAVLSYQNLSAQNLQTEWAHTYRGTQIPGYNRFASTTIDNYGNVYVLGTVKNISEKDKIAILKYDPQGNLIWNIEYNNSDSTSNPSINDTPAKIITDGSGCLYVIAGGFKNGFFCSVLNKLDLSGNFIWTRYYHYYFSSCPIIFPKDVIFNSVGEIFIAGVETNDTTLEDAFVIKYDTSGNFLWNYYYTGSGACGMWGSRDNGCKLAWDSVSGDIFLSAIINWCGSPNEPDIGIIRINSNTGNEVWLYTYPNPYSDAPSDLLIDPLGNLYIEGFRSYQANGPKDFLIFKLSSNGQLIWQNNYDSPYHSEDVCKAMSFDNDYNLILTGFSWYGASNANDYMTIKFDSAGNYLWSRNFNGCNPGYPDDQATSLYIDAARNIYVAGFSKNEFCIGKYDYNFVIVKYDENGNMLWSMNYDDSLSLNALFVNMKVDQNNNFYLAGIQADDYITNSEIVLIKYSQLTTVGIEESGTLFEDFQIFPNPATSTIQLTFNTKHNGAVQCEIWSVMGQKVFQKEIKQTDPDMHRDDVRLDVSFLAKGIYFLKAGNEVRKFVKE